MWFMSPGYDFGSHDTYISASLHKEVPKPNSSRTSFHSCHFTLTPKKNRLKCIVLHLKENFTHIMFTENQFYK